MQGRTKMQRENEREPYSTSAAEAANRNASIDGKAGCHASGSSIKLAPRPRTKPLVHGRDGDCLSVDLAADHDLLGLVVEGHLLAGLDRSHVHAQRDGVAVSSLDRRVGRLAGPDA